MINSYVTGHEIFHQIQPLLRFVMNHPPSKLTFLPVLSAKHFNATDKLRVRDAVAYKMHQDRWTENEMGFLDSS